MTLNLKSIFFFLKLSLTKFYNAKWVEFKSFIILCMSLFQNICNLADLDYISVLKIGQNSCKNDFCKKNTL